MEKLRNQPTGRLAAGPEGPLSEPKRSRDWTLADKGRPLPDELINKEVLLKHIEVLFKHIEVLFKHIEVLFKHIGAV